MSKVKAIPEEILLSIQSLPQESLRELTSFIEYLQYKNRSKKNQTNHTIKVQQIAEKTIINPAESEELIEEMLEVIGNSIPALSDYAVSRAGIYEDHP
jgi:hypothetical protein